MVTRPEVPPATPPSSTVMTMVGAIMAVLALTIAGSGCSDSAVAPSDPERAAVAADSGPAVTAEIVHDGLVGPTQFVVLDDGTFIVAAINGGENDRRGQIVSIDARSGDTTVLRDGLDKPTGVAVLDGELWVMERDRLTRSPLPDINPDGTEGAAAVDVEGEVEVEVVADDLPSNGRSEGTLTVTPDGSILFDTSGSKRGDAVVDGSGRLFTVDPAVRPGSPVELASGFKHAYAHVFDDDGVLWTTEMTDGSFDGQPGADELVAVRLGADHGWPRCVGDNRPVREFGGDPETCAEAPGSAAVFAPGATPTSVAVSPFEPATLLVALWNEDRIVRVPIGRTDDDEAQATEADPTAWTDLVTDVERPQHLVTSGDAVYVTEFGTGRILRLTAG